MDSVIEFPRKAAEPDEPETAEPVLAAADEPPADEEPALETDADAKEGAEAVEAEAQPEPEPKLPLTPEHVRMVEAVVFAAKEPLSLVTIRERLPEGADVEGAVEQLQQLYADRGVNFVCVGGKWTIRTASDLGFLLDRERVEPRKLSRAALETLAVISYHQPVTRAEIEEIRGVSLSKGTLDLLLEVGWVRIRGRRRAPGRPVTYGTSDAFLSHFGLEAITDLPGLADLKAAGLLDARLPPDFAVPSPNALPDAEMDEEPDEEEELSAQGEFDEEPAEPMDFDVGEPDEDE